MLAEPSSVADGPPAPAPAPATAIQPSSPRFLSSVAAENPPYTHRSTGIVVDLSDDSAFAVRWAVQYYLRPGDDVVLLVVSPGSVLYDADWGSIPASVSGEATAAAGGISSEEEPQKKIQEDYNAFISTKAKGVAQPLSDAQISFDVISVKDHVCFEAERLGLSAMIVGKCTFRASGKGVKGILGGVNDYCVKHCVCPIVFAPYHDDAVGDGGDATGAIDELQTVLEDEHVYQDAPKVQQDGTTFCLTSSTVEPTEEIGGNSQGWIQGGCRGPPYLPKTHGYPLPPFHFLMRKKEEGRRREEKGEEGEKEEDTPLDIRAGFATGDNWIRASKQYPLSEYHDCFTPSCSCHLYLQSPSQQSPAMAVQAGNPVNHSAQEICDDFIQQYYDKLKQPDKLYNQDLSFLGRPEPNGTMVDVTTLSAINEKIMSMGFRNGLIEIETANAQFSHMGGVLIVVIGSLTSDEGVCRRFTQSFFLAPQEHGGYFVLNDVFSFVLERKPAEINQVVTLESESSQNRSPSRTCSWVPEPTPLDGNVDSDHVQVVNNVTERQFSNPSSNRTVMEASGNTEPPVRVAQEDPIRAPDGVPPFPAPTLPDVTKKSYASVVKAMKEDPLTPPVAKTTVSAAKHELTPKQVSKAVEGLEKSSAKPTQANETSDGVVDRNNSSCNEQGYSIVVKNLPFNANIEMVEEEFKKFGAIKPGGVQV